VQREGGLGPGEMALTGKNRIMIFGPRRGPGNAAFLRKLLNRPNDSLEELAREAVTAVRNRYLQR
jgi:hypothetical protein